MTDACAACPCPATCLRWDVFCRWAERGHPRDLEHIVARSAAGESPPPASQAPPAAAAPSVAEAVALVAAAKACSFRSTRGCGCGGGGFCALKGGAKVFLPDCMNCVAKFGSS